jgi:hypothetical protein
MTTKNTKRQLNLRNGSKRDQMAIKYTSIFRCKTLQNLPKVGLKKYHLATLGWISFERNRLRRWRRCHLRLGQGDRGPVLRFFNM